MSGTGRTRRHAARAVVLALLVATTALVAAPPASAGNWITDMLGWTTPSTLAPGTPCNWLNRALGRCTPGTTTTTTSTTTSTTSPSSSSSTSPSSSTTLPEADCPDLPKPGGGTWECTFADEFDGTQLDRAKWMPMKTAEGAFDDGPECFVDDPDNVSVAGGELTLTVREEPAPIDCHGVHQSAYTSGMVTTHPRGDDGFAQAYGRWEIRARVTGAKVTGLHEAFWMLPVTPISTWPRSGEIDIAEIYHRYPDRAIPYVHYSNPFDPNRTNNYCLIDDIWEFHDYVLEWTPETIKISYDGVVCIDDPWQPVLQSGRKPFDKPFYLTLTQALGVPENAFNPATTPLPASTVVDYVRVYK